MPPTSRRVAWVTGGSRGIGRATALRLGTMGFDVAVGFHEDRLAAEAVCSLLADLGAGALEVGGDLADAQVVAHQHERIVGTLGPVDVLVASHGIYTRTPLDRLDAETWQRTIDVNLTGTFHATQRVVPDMRARRWGRIIYLGSILGRTGSTQGAHYGTTKAALLGLARSVAHEVARDGVTVNLVAPSMIDTDILSGDSPAKRAAREESVPIGRIGSAEEVAAAIAYLVSDEAGYVTGTEMRLDGGFMMG